jgi:FKBP-type peptidyl-prolyl cis-trans isomerase
MASKKAQRRSERAEARAKKRRNQQIALVAVAATLVALILIFSFGRNADTGTTTEGTGDVITTASGLQYEDLVIGNGPAAEAFQTVSVHYTGTLEDGTKFDSSWDRGTPFEFILGMGQVIAGWDEGVAGMKVGGVRRLIIPPDLGYGTVDYGPIPANSTLFFEVELMEIK